MAHGEGVALRQIGKLMAAINRTEFKEIFDAAVNLPRLDRAMYLAARCAGNEELRSEIEKLVAADEAAGNFLESSPFNESGREFASIRGRSFIGQKLGAYYIEREIGTGGMGTVFLALRELGDLRQQVAIKIVHQGAQAKEIVRRFLLERKILADLEHSGIARLIDAGETTGGLPFLVMEYVAGEPLDDYCREKNLSVDERLKLFRKVCVAVAYAHRRLIIHRDLKPPNILVTADGEPKLLDFGIAKLLAPVAADTPQTATLMNLLTPAYAAPEQIRGETITTATDVYSLGVILYELLAGVRPFSFSDKNYQAIVHLICETEPPKPSEAQTLENKKAPTRENKQDSTKATPTGRVKVKIDKSLRGDLDNIVMKSLRKDPERRYQGVEQFSEDIERYLKGLPISARPDTFSYRAAKFLARNRVAVISFGLIILLLVGGILGTTWQSVRAARQQKIAEQRFAEVRELANNVIFKYHDSIANLSGSTEVRKMLVQDATKYLDRLSQDAGTDEGLINELALAYAKLADVQGKPYAANTGDTAGAIENYQKSIKLLETLTRSTSAVKSSLAEEELIPVYHSYSSVNTRILNFDESIATQQKALDLAQRHLVPAPLDSKRRITFARSNLWLGDAYAESGDFSRALSCYRKAVDLADEIYLNAPDDRDAETILGVSHDRIGRGLLLRGQDLARTDFSPEGIAGIYQESYGHLSKTFELFKKVANENPGNQKYQRNFVVAQSNLAMALRNVGEIDRSLEMLERVATHTEKGLKADTGNHELEADHAEDLHQLALTLDAKGEPARAIDEIRSALRIIEKLIAADIDNMEFRRDQVEMIRDYGAFFFRQNDVGAALRIYQTALEQAVVPERPGATTFESFAKGMMNEKIGDCYAKIANRSSTSKSDRQADLEKAEAYYLKAANLWRTSEVQRRYLSRTPELLEYLNRKLSHGSLISKP
jgi:non-specific serine/threonine protein kinase/serine/threonine-protein kinase